MASVDVATSPRKAFSLAMRGGLKEVWAEGRCVNDIVVEDLVSVGGDLEFDLVLLRREPIVSFVLFGSDS